MYWDAVMMVSKPLPLCLLIHTGGTLGMVSVPSEPLHGRSMPHMNCDEIVAGLKLRHPYCCPWGLMAYNMHLRSMA